MVIISAPFISLEYVITASNIRNTEELEKHEGFFSSYMAINISEKVLSFLYLFSNALQNSDFKES
jgi:hypothetical protein